MIRVFCFFALATALLLYGNALQAPFQLDDPQVLENAQHPGLGTRPLAYLSFWFTGQVYNIFGGVFPWKEMFYHRLFNVVVHALAGAALFWLALELTGGLLLPSAVAGIIFLVHPIQTQAIVYVSQRFESLAALFLILSASSYARFRRTNRRAWLVAVIGSAAAAGLSKETAIVLPLWLLLIEWTFFDRQKLQQRWPHFALLALILFATVWTALPAAKNAFLWVWWPQYWLTQGPVLAKYMALSVWPREQFLVYDFPLADSFSALLLLKWILVGGVIALGVVLIKRRPVIGFGILTFFILLIPVTLLPLPDLIFEHRVYPAFAGFALAAAAAAPQTKNKLILVVVAVIVILWSIKTSARNAEWNDDISFWESHHARFPESPAILTRLGSYYFLRGYVNKGLELTEEARRYEDRFNAYYSQRGKEGIAVNLALLHITKGNAAAGKQEALRALALVPMDPLALQALGTADLRLGDFDGAHDAFQKLTEVAPANVNGWAGLREARIVLGDAEGAKRAGERLRAESENAETKAAPGIVIPAEYKIYTICGLTMVALLGLFFAGRIVWNELRKLPRKAGPMRIEI